MADKNVFLKDGADYLFPKTKAELVEGLSSKINEATAGFLPLSGGTMTGAIKANVQTVITDNANHPIIRNYETGWWIGDTSKKTIFFTNNSDLEHDKNGTTTKILDTGNTSANPTLAGTEGEATSLKLNSVNYALGKSVSYLTTAPSSANTSGRLQFVVLSSEPATKYDGYLYIITGA